jgi:putative NADH-flavin reductase
MKIALIGATGFVGSKILAEALQRGHEVTALVRSPSKVAPQPRLAVVAADATDTAQLTRVIAGHDAFVSAYNGPRGQADFRERYLAGTRAVVSAAKQAGVKRLLWVGGAGSLFVAPGVQLVDTPQFPAEYRTEAQAGRDAMNLIGQERGLDWTFVSPAALLQPGPRTGKFRLGGDTVLMDGDRPGHISVDDLAVAIVDELETPRHVQRRFTAAY